MCGPSPGPSSCHMTADQAQEDRDSVQQIIDKYSRELSASLRHAGGTAGKRLDGLFCICKTWTRLTDACNRFLKSARDARYWKLKLLTERALGPGEAGAARAITVYSITHRHVILYCILRLNAANFAFKI